MRAAERIQEPSPINLATGVESSITSIARRIAAATGYRGAMQWDAARPDGQMRRCLDISRAKELLGWEATTGLAEGLELTIQWFLANRNPAPAIR